MKKILAFALGALIAFGASAADRNHTLKVYNWADYIDEDLLDEFERWYKEQTGEEVDVVYQLFDINEVMLSKIELGHEDYDVVCPSDYIIERMLRSDLLLPISHDFGDTPDYTVNVAPFIHRMMANTDGNGRDVRDYAVGYMWGTVGLLYNPKYIPAEETRSWEVLRNPAYAGKIYVKDAFRDVYTSLLLALRKDEIDAGKVTRDEVSRDTSPESIKLVEDWLNSMKDGVQGWEADFGKEMMTKEKGWINLSWSGDAQWAIDEAEAVGVKLDFSVPEDGSTVWYDGWVIPKYAVNTKAASYFINFLCMPENALRNMDEIGYVSAIGGPEILAAKTDSTAFAPEDASYFFGPDATAVCVNPVQYPSKSIIERCGVLHDTGDRTEDLLAMWTRVKGDNASTFTYVLIGIVVAALIAGYLFSKRKKSHRRPARKH
ncbi:MAG: ABC transporter substrate-binding protein [Bacteroidales bacterium]|nr:ABC transporter substrate-binding protein [Bacteroidales bacterium]